MLQSSNNKMYSIATIYAVKSWPTDFEVAFL